MAKRGDELIVEACDTAFEKYKDACNFFLWSVAQNLVCDVLYGKTANQLCDYFDANYERLDSGILGAYEAQYLAADGWLVVVGRKADGHGHVGVVTAAELHEKYNDPFIYCGSISAYKSKGDKCVRQIFGNKTVSYWLCPTRPRSRSWRDAH